MSCVQRDCPDVLSPFKTKTQPNADKNEDDSGAFSSKNDLAKSRDRSFTFLGGAVQLAILAGFYFTKYDYSMANIVDSSSVYNFYVGIALMMFIGFGYHMTFLKAHGLSAVGFTMFICCIGVQWALLVEGMMAYGKHNAPDVPVGFMSLISAHWAVATVLISFGALLGKIGPTQILMLTVIETICYCGTKVFFLQSFIHDCGGTIVVHVFGACFGLAACFTLGQAKNEDLNKSSYTSDLFSMMGTAFLWLFWPSFVAGSLPPNSHEQYTALINTILALLASAVVTFLIPPVFSNYRLKTVPIQNAALAGGVAIGATANIAMGPCAACLIGCLAGALSCALICKPIIPSSYDTCGINSLHGFPGLFGALASVVMPWLVSADALPPYFNALHQVIGLAGTVVIASVTGGITGLILKLWVGDSSSPYSCFNDIAFWDCAADIPGKLG